MADDEIKRLLLAFRAEWEDRNKVDDERSAAVISGLKLLDSRQGVIESDMKQLRSDVHTVRSLAEAANGKAETAHTMASAAATAAARNSLTFEASHEELLAALSDTRGKLTATTEAIGGLQRTDGEMKAMIEEAAQNSAGAAIRDVVGKNPRVVGALGVILVVLAQVLTQRFLVPPAAPNQGMLPAATPTVNVAGDHP